MLSPQGCPSNTLPSLPGPPRGVHLDLPPFHLLVWLLGPRTFPCLPCVPWVAPRTGPRWALGCGGLWGQLGWAGGDGRGAESWTEPGTWPGLSAGPGRRFCTKNKPVTEEKGKKGRIKHFCVSECPELGFRSAGPWHGDREGTRSLWLGDARRSPWPQHCPPTPLPQQPPPCCRGSGPRVSRRGAPGPGPLPGVSRWTGGRGHTAAGQLGQEGVKKHPGPPLCLLQSLALGDRLVSP